MSRFTWLSSLTLFLLTGSAVPAWGAVCRPHDATAERVRLRLARYAIPNHPDDETVRAKLGLPQTAQISVVSSESVCKKADAAYRAELTGPGQGGFSGQVYVIKVGTTYAVFDPAYHWGPEPGYYTVIIFDSRWRKLSRHTP
jgi:hypothetical protein